MADHDRKGAQSAAAGAPPVPLDGDGRLRQVAVVALLAMGLTLPAFVVSGVPDSVRIPVLEERIDDEPPAVFSHWQHNQFQCYSCHPSIFPQRKVGFTHADMTKGLYCGSCHDDGLAFHVDDRNIACDRCHVGGEGELDALDIDDLFD